MSTDLQEEEKQLFAEWCVGNDKSFIEDGVFDWPAFQASKRKICFVLLESYDCRPENICKQWNLQEKRKGKDRSLGDGLGGHTNAALARWAYGLVQLEKNPSWADVMEKTKTEEQRITCFSATAQINLRKIPWHKATTDMNSLRDYVDQNRQWLLNLIRRQWELYQPDVTICGGWLPFWCTYTALGGIKDEVKRLSNNVQYWTTTSGQIILEGNHPAARISAQRKYMKMIDAVTDIFNK